jgi:hypothetical protein
MNLDARFGRRRGSGWCLGNVGRCGKEGIMATRTLEFLLFGMLQGRQHLGETGRIYKEPHVATFGIENRKCNYFLSCFFI